MSSYLEKHIATPTPQSETLPGENQVENAAGGFVYGIDAWTQLQRFLVLGTESGSYYASAREMTVKAVECARLALQNDGPRVVQMIVDISVSGRGPKNDPCILALAMACSVEDVETKRAACAAIPKVCRTGTHLFMFCEMVQHFRGWGRMLADGVAAWYLDKTTDSLGYQAVKYRQRGGWTHRDVLRVSHPKTDDSSTMALFDWICGRDVLPEHLPDVVNAYAVVQEEKDAKEIAGKVVEFNLPWEALPTEVLKDPVVWRALLPSMGLTALIRNLGRMTAIGVFETSEAVATVVHRLKNEEEVRKSRVHPIQVLAAMKVYTSGGGFRGSLIWTPHRRIVDAIDSAFYASFGNIEETDQKLLIALDVSGSMMSPVNGMPFLSAREATCAVAMALLQRCPNSDVVAFTSSGSGRSFWTGNNSPRDTGRRWGYNAHNDGLSPLDFSPRQRLDDVVRRTAGLPFGATDCALPALYATAQGTKYDGFVILTDSESWAGTVHASVALRNYRRKVNAAARMVVMATTATNYSIADPKDAGSMDVVGFDTAAPQLVQDFMDGKF